MSESTERTGREKFVRLLIKSIGICIFGGGFFGAFAWVLWMAVEGGDPWRLIYLPLIVLAAIIPTSLIIGTVYGLIAALLASCLARTAFVRSR